MNIETSISRLIQELQKKDIRFTKDAEKDFRKLIKIDSQKFIEVFYKDFIRKDFDNYARFKTLRLDNYQKTRLRGYNLRRYEYRNTSNFRCIFIIYSENNKDTVIILNAFNEDGDKNKGNKSYNKNIERAIEIFEKMVEE